MMWPALPAASSTAEGLGTVGINADQIMGRKEGLDVWPHPGRKTSKAKRTPPLFGPLHAPGATSQSKSDSKHFRNACDILPLRFPGVCSPITHRGPVKMNNLELQQLSVKQLHDRLADRVFAVPQLQREFVWNGPRAAALLDSIYRNMPIGSILVWETRSAHYDLLRQNLHILPAFNTASSYGWFLIDGQQRLSVLHEAVAGGIKKNSGGQEIDFGRLCFDLAPDGDEEPVSFAYRKPIERRLVPIQDILAANWRRRLRDYPQYLLKRLQDCRQRVRKYKVPVVVIRSNDLEEVREVFIRINAQGLKISAADRAFAKASSVDLRRLAQELRAGINPDFQDVDYNTILQGFTFVTTERELDVGQRAMEATITWWERRIDGDGRDSAFYERWKKYRIAFGKAVDYLCATFCVLDRHFLPSENMLATLSIFFYYHPAAPSAKHRIEMKKWFWATGVGQRYSGRGFRQNLIADVEFFRRLSRSSSARFRFDERVDRSDINRSEYGQNSSLNAAFYCLLLVHDPRYLQNGEPIRYDLDKSRANRGNRHHIFPRQLLANSGVPHRDYNSLCNICLVVSEENQMIGMLSPASYLAHFRKKKHFKRAMNSHLMPYDSKSGLWTRGARDAFAQFRRRRLDVICRAFETTAGLKLFRKA